MKLSPYRIATKAAGFFFFVAAIGTFALLIGPALSWWTVLYCIVAATSLTLVAFVIDWRNDRALQDQRTTR